MERDYLRHALFTEMYGFPLTIYLLSGSLTSHFPGVDWTSHDAGHFLEMILGWRSNPHFGPFHVLSFILIGGGFWLLATSWRVLYAAQHAGRLATSGHIAVFATRSTQASWSCSASSCNGRRW